MIFNAAVMDDRKTVLRDVRVRVALARDTMSGPSGMRDTQHAVIGRAIQGVLKCLNLPPRSQSVQVMGIVDDSDAGRIVAAVLQSPQSFHEDRNDVALSN